MRTGWVEEGTYLSPRGVRNFNKYLAQACQNGGGGAGVGGTRGAHAPP